MTDFYDDLAETALELLTEYGQSVTITRSVAGAYDPEAGASTIVSTPYTGQGAAFDYSQREIDGTNIQARDQRLLLATTQANGAAMPEPQTGDAATVNGTVYRVMGSRPLQPGGQVVLHDVQLRA